VSWLWRPAPAIAELESLGVRLEAEGWAHLPGEAIAGLVSGSKWAADRWADP